MRRKIDADDPLIVEAREIVERLRPDPEKVLKDRLRLGEIAHLLTEERAYNEDVIGKAAKAIGINRGSFERYRSVHRAWMKK